MYTKTLFNSLLSMIIFSLSFSSFSATWHKIMYCENDSVRLEESKTGPFEYARQLVISDKTIIDKLERMGAVNQENINKNGEFILQNVFNNYSSYGALVGRDQGRLLYSIQPSYNNHLMIFTVAYVEGEITGYVQPFNGITFYNCNY